MSSVKIVPSRSVSRIAFLAALTLVALLASAFAHAGIPRILVVGDSWAQGIYGFQAFPKVFAAHGVTDIEVRGQTTAIGGSRADQWAHNQKGKNDALPKLDALKQALEADPTIDIVHLSIGGNDFLRATMEENIVAMTPDQRKVVWERICKDIRTLIDFIHAQRPTINVLLNDYDYLNPDLMRKVYQMKVPESVTPKELNKALLEFAQYKCEAFSKVDHCTYIQHFGLLQYYYGNPPDVAKAAGPLPGTPPKYEPFAGGNPEFPNSLEAMPDGVHPMPEGYQYIIERCYNTVYKNWLAEGKVAAAAGTAGEKK